MPRKPEARPYRHLYDSQQWKRARLAFLSANPLCEECGRRSLVVGATVVDHRRAHKGDLALFWDQSNWAASCKPCHDRKTASMDGGFGNPIKTKQRIKGCDENGHPFDGWD